MIALVASLLLASAPAEAQDLKKPDLTMRMAPLEVVTRPLKFPSGLTVILQRDDKANFLNVATVHGGGVLIEKEPGSAHIAEHLVYEAQLGNGRVKDRLYAEGVDYDANSMDWEWMIFRATGPVSSLGTILEFEGQKLSNALNGITEADLAQAQTIGSLERYYRMSGTFAAGWEKLLPNLHNDEMPLGSFDPTSQYWAGGPSVTLDHVEDWTSRGMVPEETTIVIYGPIDFDESIAVLFDSLPPSVLHPDATEEHLRTFLKPNVVNPDPENPDHVTSWLEDPETGELLDLTTGADDLGGRIDWEAPEPQPVDSDYNGDVLHIDGLVTAPIAAVAWATPGSWVGQDSLNQLAGTALANAGFRDWGGLFDIAREANGSRKAGCGHQPGLKAGHLACWAYARDNRVNADELTDRLLAASSVFSNPDATQLHTQSTEAGRRTALGNTLHELENYADTTKSLAARTALNTHYYGDPTYTSQQMNEMMGVPPTAIRPWVQAWLPEARAVSVVVDPLPRDKWLSVQPTASYHGALFGHSIPETDDPPTNQEVAEAYQAIDMSTVVEETLPNGLTVAILPEGSLPVVTVGLAAKGGSLYGMGLDNVSRLTTRTLWDEIYEDTTGGKQDLLPDKIGAQPIFSALTDMSFEGFAAPTRNLDGALYLLRRNDMARKVKIAGKTTWWKAIRLQLPRLWDSRNHWANMERMERMFPDHPVGWVLDQESANRLKELSASELADYQAQKFNPDNAMLVIAGDVDPDEAMKLAKQYWGDWKRSSPKKLDPMPPKPEPTGAATLWLDSGSAERSVVSASCPLPAPDAKTLASQRVLGSVLQESLGAQLREAGADATASTASFKEAGGLAWIEMIAVVPHGNVTNGVDAVKGLADRATAGEFDAGRLQQHKLRVAGREVFNSTTTRIMLQSVAEAYMMPNRGKDFYEVYGSALAEVDGDSIAKAAAGCADNLVVTVESPEDSLGTLQSDYGAEPIDWRERSDRELEVWDKRAYKRRLKQRAKGK